MCESKDESVRVVKAAGSETGVDMLDRSESVRDRFMGARPAADAALSHPVWAATVVMRDEGTKPERDSRS
ncbi:hypothetical protein OPKNFCMD_1030 [Methylobacterium crusticola]|uniref:Uncharacterized protein n=1 Tax=Methylobacterium crusticola TaxID=1697972 RepID=A0ABQ4QSM9_9HYPH|nr:hypothetical protein [Methylobacterium crusticola]GJD48313.1 hypothetical protein OPKNFCMD_1030 [Methylobacterium crusticola]